MWESAVAAGLAGSVVIVLGFASELGVLDGDLIALPPGPTTGEEPRPPLLATVPPPAPTQQPNIRAVSQNQGDAISISGLIMGPDGSVYSVADVIDVDLGGGTFDDLPDCTPGPLAPSLAAVGGLVGPVPAVGKLVPTLPLSAALAAGAEPAAIPAPGVLDMVVPDLVRPCVTREQFDAVAAQRSEQQLTVAQATAAEPAAAPAQLPVVGGLLGGLLGGLP